MSQATPHPPGGRDDADEPLVDLETEAAIVESIGERTAATGLPPGGPLLLILVAGVELAKVLLRALGRLLWRPVRR